MNIRQMRGSNFVTRTTTSREDLAQLVQEKLEELGYFPTYITPELKREIRDLQEDELELRKSKTFTLEKGVGMLQDIDKINAELLKLARNHDETEIAARKRRCVKPKQKRKIIKKTIKHKK